MPKGIYPRTKKQYLKIAKANRGLHRSKETREKISKANKGKCPWNKGSHWSKEVKDKISKSRIGQVSPNKGKKFPQFSGKKHHNWTGGKRICTDGYIRIWVSPYKYNPEHRLKMEKYLKRPLKQNEIVHHINGKKTDNRIKNLLLCANIGEHKKLHRKINWNIVVN